MRIGIYIGSFNPPHLGHKEVIDYLITNDYVDNLLLIPTKNYWDKQNLIDINHRINMLKYYESDFVKVDTNHNNYAYTYELLTALKEEYPKDELYLIIGADNIVRFNEWKNVKEIMKHKIIVINRKDLDINSYLEKYHFNKKQFIIINNFKPIDISSTEIRKNLTSKNLDAKVYKYIEKNNLYQ